MARPRFETRATGSHSRAPALARLGKVDMLPDGNGNFTNGMGLLVDKSDLGFGPRSWRYSMLVRDGVIERMFVEDFATPGDPFEVSDAPTMLKAMSLPVASSA